LQNAITKRKVKSNPKQPSHKKKCAALKMPIGKKDVKSNVVAKKSHNGRLMTKKIISTIQVNLCFLLHVSLGFGTNPPELLL